MKLQLNKIPRTFTVGRLKISDFGHIHLEPDEMIVFERKNGRCFDFVAKDWGYYATPSINGRLRDQGFKTAIVKNPNGKIFVLVVDQDKITDFLQYCDLEGCKIVNWLDEADFDGVC